MTTTIGSEVEQRKGKTDPASASDSFGEWRGVGAEGENDISNQGTEFLRRRSMRLLGELLRPYRKLMIIILVAVLLENGARLSIPWLVSRGIDHGVTPILNGGSAAPLLEIVMLMLLMIGIQAISRIVFLRSSGGVGQRVLLEVRRRVFSHFQKLDVAFHDRYTSGRVVSRLTSDIDAIQELLASGFDSLINAVLTMVGVAVLMLLLDVKLGLVCLLSFPFLFLLARWFSRNSSQTYRKVRENSALVIVQFVETMTGIRAVQAYRREPRNQEIFSDVAGRYRDVNTRSFRLVAIFMPGIKLIGNLTIGVALLYGGYRALEGDVTIGVLAAFLLYLRMFFEPMQNISQFLQHLPLGLLGTGEALRRAGGEGFGARAGAADAGGPGPRRDGAGPRRLPLRQGPARSARSGSADPRGTDTGVGRHHRCRQDHYRQADVAVLRPDPGPGADRRHQSA